MTDWAQKVVDLVQEALPSVTVYDGQPAEKLEDRPEVHLIVDVNVPALLDESITSARDSEIVKWQVRTIVRSGESVKREDAAWSARWHSKKVRDYLVQRRLRPGGQLVAHTVQTGFVDDQAMASHSTQIQVSQYEAKV